MEQLAACVACGAPAANGSARVVYRRRDDALVRCPRCRSLYANPQYTDEELGPLYTREYYDAHKNLETDFRERDFQNTRDLYYTVVHDLLRRHPELRPSPGRPRRVLDFGCGVGFFLVACREAGLEPTGIDWSDVASQYARQRFDLEVLTDAENALRNLPADHYHVITAWQVIEHMRRPRETLALLTRALAPGGLLCIAVPNLGALAHRWQRDRWFNIQNLTHLVFFTRDRLQRALEEAGLTQVERPVLLGGLTGLRRLLTPAQYLLRAANLGNEFRLYARKPGVLR
ncbi:MAG TPA: class I SAM-dependent methyltransferase [Polyangia bacterium]|nr:class I SAM-dependent methyltransferase [Polyangia bacterium]